MGIREQVKAMKASAPGLASLPAEVRNRALGAVSEALRSHAGDIFAANREDVERAEADGVPAAIRKRLNFDRAKLEDVCRGIELLISLPDPLGRESLVRELDETLLLRRVSCPIGVIGVIFEARPDALVQISSLCIKSGNCAVLKGGRETARTNKVLFDLILQAAVQAGLPAACMIQAELHSEIDELLDCDDCVDLLIPRGSNAFVQNVMRRTRIPVMGHADGICHIYVDRTADFDLALPVIVDAKTQYCAACNAVETILVHRDIAGDFLPLLAGGLEKAGVTLRGTEEVTRLTGGETIGEEDFVEYLDLILSVKLVGDIEEAVDHINSRGSHHTDCILSEDGEAVEFFMQRVDSAGVYHNCSTRFADGFRYGFGAEVGISTGKLHARGPVGLEGLVTYKYRLYGHGDIVGDYASGKKKFHFRDRI